MALPIIDFTLKMTIYNNICNVTFINFMIKVIISSLYKYCRSVALGVTKFKIAIDKIWVTLSCYLSQS
jgi:hypothetical protein